jgi:Rha family phage regulatory protein
MDLSKPSTITSLEIAKLTNKSHYNIIRDIKNIIQDLDSQGLSHQLNFELVNYTDAGGKPRPMYELTKKGALLLASGYDTVLRYKIIERLEKLELEKRMTTPAFEVPTPREIAHLILRLEDEKEKLQLELKEATPKVEYTDKVLTSKTGVITTIIAKELGMTANALNTRLQQMGIQYKRGKTWVLSAKYQDKGYTKSITSPYRDNNGQIYTSQLTVWTEKGRHFIHSLFNSQLTQQSLFYEHDTETVQN